MTQSSKPCERAPSANFYDIFAHLVMTQFSCDYLTAMRVVEQVDGRADWVFERSGYW